MGEVFIQHYYSHYDRPELPPSWMITEILPLGRLSKVYSMLKFRDDQKLIAHDFGLHYEILISWLRSLSFLRNMCAHYCRVWNRIFTIKPITAKRYAVDLANNDRIYAFAVICNVLLKKICPDSQWQDRFIALLDQNPNIPIESMGFRNGWREGDLWGL
jgi:abortive infection bacteriophage resistance protein